MTDLIKPKEIVLKTQDGVEKAFLLSRLPATVGREVVATYPVSNIPKVGDYQASDAIMVKLMSYVAVITSEGTPLRLSTRALIDNHCEDWETLARLEYAQLEYNVSFLQRGRTSGFYEELLSRAAAKITPMLTGFLRQLSEAGKPPSKN